MECLIRGLAPKLHRRWYRPKKQSINLDELPSDIIIMIFLSLDNTSDLYSLVRTSTTFKYLFNRYRRSILLRVCKTIVGSSEATWKALAAVLVYQRQVNVNARHYLPDFATMKFTLEDQDVPQLIDNLLMFKSTAKKFSKYLNSSGNDHITAGCSYKPGDRLSKQAFFENWLLEFQVRYDPITTFAKRESYNTTQLTDAALIRIAMFCGCYSYDPQSGPLWERKSHQHDVAARNRVISHTSSCPSCHRYNKLLWLKMIYHYDFMIWKDGEDGEDTITPQEYHRLMRKLCGDMARGRSVEYLVEKYELSCGWDREG